MLVMPAILFLWGFFYILSWSPNKLHLAYIILEVHHSIATVYLSVVWLE